MTDRDIAAIEREARRLVNCLWESYGSDIVGRMIVDGDIGIRIRGCTATEEEIRSGEFLIAIEGSVRDGELEVFSVFVSPVAQRGSVEHGVFGQALQRYSNASIDEILLAIRPRQGVREPDPVFGEGAPVVEVRYEGRFPPSPLQDERAAALYTLLQIHSWREDLPVIRVISGLAHDVFVHLYNIIGEQLVSSAGMGAIALASYLLPYGYYVHVRDAGVRFFLGTRVPQSIQDVARDIWVAAVAEPAMRVQCETALAKMGGVQKAMENRSPSGDLIKRGESVLEKAREMQAGFTRHRQRGEKKPNARKCSQVAKEVVEWLLDARAAVPLSSSVLSADMIGYAFPAPVSKRTGRGEGTTEEIPTNHLQDLMSWLLPQTVLQSAKGKFPTSTRPVGTIAQQRVTASEAVQRASVGVLPRTDLIRTICGSLKSVVIILDASGSMNPAISFLRTFIEDVSRLFPEQLEEWKVVVINNSLLYVWDANGFVGKRISANGMTPLFPATALAQRLGKDNCIIITDWEHNCHEADSDEGKIRAESPVRPAKNVLSLSVGEDMPTLPRVEGGVEMNVRVNLGDYFSVLTEIAKFAELVAPATLAVEISEGDRVRMVFRRQ